MSKLKNLKPAGFIAVVGWIVGIVGVFLAWTTAHGAGQSASQAGIKTGEGQLALAAAVLAAILFFVGVAQGGKPARIILLILGVLVALFAVLGIPVSHDVVDGITITYSSGIGLYLDIVGGALVLIGGVIALKSGLAGESGGTAAASPA